MPQTCNTQRTTRPRATWESYLGVRNKAGCERSAQFFRDQLVGDHLDIARKIARQEFRRLKGLMSYDDCESYAFEGLVKAVEQWNPDRGAWERHSDYRIRMQVKEGCRERNGRKGVNQQELRRMLKRFGLREQAGVVQSVLSHLGDWQPERIAEAIVQVAGATIEQAWEIVHLADPQPKLDFVSQETLHQLIGAASGNECPADLLDSVRDEIKDYWDNETGDSDRLAQLYQLADLLQRGIDIAAQPVKESPPPLQETLF